MTTAAPSPFDVRTIAGRFRVVALAEAVSWIGLLVGMYFKRLHTPSNEVGVQVFGPIHGAIFVLFLVVGVVAAVTFRWSVKTCLLALLGSIVPLGSVMFVMWADRTAALVEDDSAPVVGEVVGSGPRTP